MRLKENKLVSHNNNELLQDSRKTNITNMKPDSKKGAIANSPRAALYQNSVVRAWAERVKKRRRIRQVENLNEYQINLLSDKVYLKEHKKDWVREKNKKKKYKI